MRNETELSKIYAPLWNKYDKLQKDKAVSLFAGRLKTNGFRLSWFKNKVCLDAGCGSGRYINALVELKAKRVVGIDLDIKTAEANISKENQESKVLLIKGNITNIPYINRYFDFVCCNGVIHHTKNPEQIIKELDRVLKVGGYLFLYVFDCHTQDWDVIDCLRKINKEFPAIRFSAFLKSSISLPENKVFQFTDLLYAPIQTKFTRISLKRLLPNYDVKFLDVPHTEYDKPGENRLIAKKLK